MVSRRLCVLVTACLALALHLNTLPGVFVFDDHEAIENNRDVRSDNKEVYNHNMNASIPANN